MYKLIKQHWQALRQHVRTQRRPELTSTAVSHLWEEFNIEFREYFKQVQKYLYTSDTGDGVEPNQTVSTEGNNANMEDLAQTNSKTQGEYP